MKRYEHHCSYDGGGMGDPVETADGEWVRYDDAMQAVAAERERIFAALLAMHDETKALHNYYAHAVYRIRNECPAVEEAARAASLQLEYRQKMLSTR